MTTVSRWAIVGALAMLASLWAGLPALADIPYNGGFELGADAPGWELNGGWELKGSAARSGKAGLLLSAAAATGGETAVSTGYCPARPGQALPLKLSYRAPEGGLTVGLRPCDALGQPLGDLLPHVLEASAKWTDFTGELALPADGLPANVATVRLVLTVTQEASEFAIDNVSLGSAGTAKPALALPKTDPLKVTNLLPALATGGKLGWTAVGAAGYASGQVTFGRTPPTVTLRGGEAAAAVISPRIVVDLSAPYRV